MNLAFKQKLRNTRVNMPTSGRFTFQLLLPVLLVVGDCDALRMINLDAPESALQGDTIELSCFFALEGFGPPNELSRNPDHGQQKVLASSRGSKSEPASEKFKRTLGSSDLQQPPLAPSANNHHHRAAKQAEGNSNNSELLYAIKWYKDEREFFRYLAQEWPHKQALSTDGSILVDLDKSDNHTVVLKSVSLRTSGLFRCEVSTDEPFFVTKSIERRMLIYSLPNEGPQIESIDAAKKLIAPRFFQAEHVVLLCSASESKPAAVLDWIINDSLNLSSSEWAHLAPLFQIKSQRFVRLRPKSASAKILPATLYEIRNQTFFPVQGSSVATKPGINPPIGTLDQLLETSTSRLNLTYQQLSSRLLNSRQAPYWLPGNSTTKLPNHQSKGLGKQIMLKVKCVARVLHLTMSDEVKVQLYNKTREIVSKKSNQLEFQNERHFEAQRESSRAISIREVDKFFIVTLLIIITIKQLSF